MAPSQTPDHPDTNPDPSDLHRRAARAAEAWPEVDLRVDGAVATVTIDRIARHNAITWATTADLRAALAWCKATDGVRVVVLTGAGDRSFCTGADLSGMIDGAGATELHHARGELAGLFEDLWALGKPTIARVQGYAIAGGFGLALACDLVVAADTATFGAPEIDRGLWPHMISVPLTRSMPPKVALELMMTGRRVDAAEALRIGFVNRVVPPAALDEAVDELAQALAGKSQAAMRLGRDAFYATWDLPAREALALLHPMITVTAATRDAAEGIAAFDQKRPPVWQHR